MCEWRECTLGEVLELKRGYDLPTRLRTAGPFPVVSSSGTTGTHKEAKVKGPGVVTGRYGTLGEVFYIEGDFWPLNTTLYVRDFKGSDPKFISYFLRTIDFLAYSDKAAVPGVNRNHVHQASVLVPDLQTQRRIAHILGTLDDKIELNRRMNRTLEAIARAVFKSWFIDFDPVIDNAILNGKPIPEELRKRAEIRMGQNQPSPLPSPFGRGGGEILGGQSPSASGRGARGGGAVDYHRLFPDEFQDSPLGKIPKGWEIKPIVGIAEFVNGRNFTKNASGTGRMVIRIAELNRGAGGSTVFNDIASAPENTAHPGDILFAWSGSLGVFRWHGDEALINQHIFKVIPKGPTKWFVYFHLLQAMPYFRMVAAGKATTMGHIKRTHLSDVLLSIPPAKLLSAVDEVVGPLYSRIHVVEQETRSLERTRDVLLPHLLSGESASIRGDAIHD